MLQFSRVASLCLLVELRETESSAYLSLTFNAKNALKVGLR